MLIILSHCATVFKPLAERSWWGVVSHITFCMNAALRLPPMYFSKELFISVIFHYLQHVIKYLFKLLQFQNSKIKNCSVYDLKRALLYIPSKYFLFYIAYLYFTFCENVLYCRGFYDQLTGILKEGLSPGFPILPHNDMLNLLNRFSCFGSICISVSTEITQEKWSHF